MDRKVLVDMFRTVTMPTTGQDGGNAIKKIVFTKDTPVRPGGRATLEDSQDIHQEELDARQNGEGNILKTYLHPELYANMNLSWYFCCIPVLNESDPLAYMMFAKQIGDAIAIFGPESLNVKKLKYKFSKATGQDYDTWFISQQELEQKQQEMAQAGTTVQPGGGNPPQINTATSHGAQPGAKPTVAKIAQGARPQMTSIMK